MGGGLVWRRMTGGRNQVPCKTIVTTGYCIERHEMGGLGYVSHLFQ